jgi:hypothetical protein
MTGDVRQTRVNINPILPLKFSPHAPELQSKTPKSGPFNTIQETHSKPYLSLIAIRRLDIIHNINMDIIQNHTTLSHIRALPQDTPKDNTRLGTRDLDGRFDTLESMRRDSVHRRPFDDLEVTQSRKVKAEVLECVGRLVDEEDVYKTVC